MFLKIEFRVNCAMYPIVYPINLIFRIPPVFSESVVYISFS